MRARSTVFLARPFSRFSWWGVELRPSISLSRGLVVTDSPSSSLSKRPSNSRKFRNPRQYCCSEAALLYLLQSSDADCPPRMIAGLVKPRSSRMNANQRLVISGNTAGLLFGTVRSEVRILSPRPKTHIDQLLTIASVNGPLSSCGQFVDKIFCSTEMTQYQTPHALQKTAKTRKAEAVLTDGPIH